MVESYNASEYFQRLQLLQTMLDMDLITICQFLELTPFGVYPRWQQAAG